jgi:hypothetical protein
MAIINRRNVKQLLFLLAIFSTFSFFYFPMVNNWFFIDDLQWIWSSSNARWKEIFFAPEVMRGMAPFFTPMLAVSFKIDWSLFGIDSMGYAVHSLTSLVAAAVALYLFIRLYATRDIALTGVFFFLLNPSTIAVTSWFSARHYLEGLFFSLLSLYFFVKADRKGKISFASGILYLLASLEKELYVVLPAVAVLVSEKNLSRRLKNTVPLGLGLIIYALWRYAVIRGMGGYTMMQSINLKPAFLHQIIKLYSVSWFGDYYVLGYLFLLIAFLLSLREIRMFLIFLVLLVPILPLGVKLGGGGYYANRYFFHISIFMICGMCLVMQSRSFGNKFIYKSAAIIVFFLIAASFIKQDIQISSILRQERAKAKEEAMALIHSDRAYVKSDLFLTGFYNAFRNIYHTYFGIDIKARPVPPEGSLRYCSVERLQEITAAGIKIPYDEILAEQKKLYTGPISIRLTLRNYRLAWDLGPEKRGTYGFLAGPVSGLYYGIATFPPVGSLMIGKNPRNEVVTTYFRILHETRDKRKVISPEFVIRLPGSQTIEYDSE